jgi:hypothetical protein
MAIHAFLFCLGKYECFMAVFTVQQFMLSDQGKICGIVIESCGAPPHLPAFSGMAVSAVSAEILSMGRLRHQIQADGQDNDQ